MNRPLPSLLLSLCACAILLFADALAADPYREGRVAFSGRRYDTALQHFNRALQQNPRNGNPLFYIGYIEENRGQRLEAIASYRRAVDLQMDADLREKAYWKIVLHYHFVEDWENLAIYSERFSRVSNAPRIRQLHSEAQAKQDPTIAQANRLMQQARAEEQRGDSDQAIESYRRLLSLRHDHQEARWNLAQLLMRNRSYAQAEPHLRELVRQNSDSWQYHYRLGLTLYHLNNFTGALDSFATVRRLNDSSDATYQHFINLGEGLAYLEQGEWGRAEPRLGEALRHRETALAFGSRARALHSLGRHGPAGESARKALKLEEGQRDGLFVLAMIDLEAGRRPSARQQLERFAAAYVEEYGETRAPTAYVEALYTLGKLEIEERRWSEARNYLSYIQPEWLRGSDTVTLRESRVSASRAEIYHLLSGIAAMELGHGSEALRSFQLAGRIAEASYRAALIHAREENPLQARISLQRSLDADPTYWQLARRESAFTTLRRQSDSFEQFFSEQESRNFTNGVETQTPEQPTQPVEEEPQKEQQ